MRRTILTMMMSASLVATAGWADDNASNLSSTNDPSLNGDMNYNEEAGSVADDTANADVNVKGDDTIIYSDHQKAGSAETSTADMGEYRSALKNEALGIKPQVGAMVFNNPLTGNKDARAAYGATIDLNLTRLATSNPTPVYLGLSTGGLYSHFGGSNSNFFGTGNSTGGQNLLLIPANAKIGYNLTDGFRLGAHGGGNVIYRSQQNALSLGSNSVGAGSDWSIFPNAGLDLEFGLGRNAALIIRPDMTFTSGENLFTGTVGFSLPIG